jgi:hypothetical protein
MNGPAKPGAAFKKAQPAGLKADKAMANMKSAGASLSAATKGVQTAGPGQHANAMKTLSNADARNSAAQSSFMDAKKKADAVKKPTMGQTIGTRAPARPSSPAPAAKPTTGIAKVLPKALAGKLPGKK